MGIKFHCSTCDKKLHVKAFLAGKRGICPHCGARIRIPQQSAQEAGRASGNDPNGQRAVRRRARQRVASRQAATESDAELRDRRSGGVAAPPGMEPTDPLDEAPTAVWYVRPPSGGQYGPADGSMMRRWLGEGRVAREALVWREGWEGWEAACDVFPQLAAEAALPDGAETATADEPTAAETAMYSTTRAAAQRHKTRPRKDSQKRNVVVIVILSAVCVALLIALGFVLYQQS
jgi:hypothetical protein